MSYYTKFSNTNPDGSPVTFTQALSDVFLHPFDSLRGFVSAPLALLAGSSTDVAKAVSGMALESTSDLPSIADIVSSAPASKTQTPTTDTPATADTVPTWVKFIIGAAAVAAAVVVVKRAM